MAQAHKYGLKDATAAVMFNIIHSYLTFSITHMHHSCSSKYILCWNYFLPQYITPVFTYPLIWCKKDAACAIRHQNCKINLTPKENVFPLTCPSPCFLVNCLRQILSSHCSKYSSQISFPLPPKTQYTNFSPKHKRFFVNSTANTTICNEFSRLPNRPCYQWAT